jgi:hypothetical protein
MSIDLEHEVRTYAEYLDEVLPTVTADSVRTGIPDRPHPVTAPPPWYRRPVVVFLASIVVVLSVAVAQLPFLNGPTVTTTPHANGGFTCPAGSTPDQPGPPDQPRPGGGAATFDPHSGRVLTLGGTFDVCTNTWTAAPEPVAMGPVAFVFDVDSDRAIAFAPIDREDAVQVWAYEPDGQTWTRKADWAVGSRRELLESPPPNFVPDLLQRRLQAVYDPVTGLVVVREIHSAQMWTYDVDTDTWTEIDQGATLPRTPAEESFPVEGFPYYDFLTYDASVDRLILYVASEEPKEPAEKPEGFMGTWEFDIRAGRWEKQQTNTPQVDFWWIPNGSGFVYDEANQVSVLLRDDILATYDASEHLWTVIQYEIEQGEGTTYDPVNERIVVTGEEQGTFAFDIGTGEWITLLEPLELEPTPDGGRAGP